MRSVASYWLVKDGDHTSEAARRLALMRGWLSPPTAGKIKPEGSFGSLPDLFKD